MAENLLHRLVEQHEVPLSTASHIVCEVHERAALGLAAGLNSDSLMLFIKQLDDRGGINYSLVLRSLCAGNLELLFHVIALRCELSAEYVRERFLGSKRGDAEILWQRSGLPEDLQELALDVVGVLKQSQKDATKWDEEEYRGRIIERILARCAKMGASFSEEDADFILDAKFNTGSIRRN